MGSNIGHQTASPILYGNLVSTIELLEDLQGNLGLFFLFPDVSIRWRGRYRLGVTLARLSGWVVRVMPWTLFFRSNAIHAGLRSDSFEGTQIAEQAAVLAEARTRPFDVLALSQYTVVRMLIFVLRCFYDDWFFPPCVLRLLLSLLWLKHPPVCRCVLSDKVPGC